jgi:hypothetical protein
MDKDQIQELLDKGFTHEQIVKMVNKKNQNREYKNIIDRLTHGENMKLFIVLFVFIVVILIVGLSSVPNQQPSPSPTVTTPSNNVPVSDGTVLNISDIVLTISDTESSSNNHAYDENYTSLYKDNEYYSEGTLKFDVLTNGSIYNYSINIKFYNGDKIVSTYTKEATSSYSDPENLTNGINHVSLSLSNSGSQLPKNGTITDLIITLEAKINGVNTKLFEAPKTNVGNFKLRYYKTPNPNYKPK